MSTFSANPGLIYIFTGDGKGKTSAALGTVIRGLAQGWDVSWVAFYKEASWKMSEYELPTMLQPQYRQHFSMHLLGKGFYIQQPESILQTPVKKIKVARVQQAKVVDTAQPEEHIAAARAALTKALTVLRDQKPQLLVLDEVCNAINDGLIGEEEVLQFLSQRGSTHIVLTGRSASKKIVQSANLVSQIKKVKHPYDTGTLAVKGLDF